MWICIYIYCGVGVEVCGDIYYTVYDGFDVDICVIVYIDIVMLVEVC